MKRIAPLQVPPTRFPSISNRPQSGQYLTASWCNWLRTRPHRHPMGGDLSFQVGRLPAAVHSHHPLERRRLCYPCCTRWRICRLVHLLILSTLSTLYIVLQEVSALDTFFAFDDQKREYAFPLLLKGPKSLCRPTWLSEGHFTQCIQECQNLPAPKGP